MEFYPDPVLKRNHFACVFYYFLEFVELVFLSIVCRKLYFVTGFDVERKMKMTVADPFGRIVCSVSRTVWPVQGKKTAPGRHFVHQRL